MHVAISDECAIMSQAEKLFEFFQRRAKLDLV